MKAAFHTREHGAVQIEGDIIRRFSSPGTAMVTVITLDSGTTATIEDIPLQIMRKLGIDDKDGPFIRVSAVDDESGAEHLHGDWIAMMDKPRSDEDWIDPTRMTLVDGSALEVTESIKTINARLSSRGFEPIAIDIPTTERPASLMPGAVEKAEPAEDGLWTVSLKGGTEIQVRDLDPVVLAQVRATSDDEELPILT